MSSFVCRIFNESGVELGINLPQSHPAWMDMLNLFCGVTPVEWIDDSSHNKLFHCTRKLKNRIHEICSSYKSQEFDLYKVENYFNCQIDNTHLAFLREGALLKVDNNLIKKAIFMVGNANFSASYDIISYGDKEEYTGPDDLKTCICRFCGKKYPEVRFKKKNAHAIPDALGNKFIFCNDECQSCNSVLSYIDKELTEYLKFRRSENKIANKKNKIIQVYGHNFYYDGPTGELKISRLAILYETESQYFVKLEGADPITHLGIYKTLAKIAIDLMPRDLVNEFGTTIDWIKGYFVPKVLPNVFYVYRDSCISQPLVKVFVRHKQTVNSQYPKCIVALTLIDLTFFYIVPFGKDEQIYESDYLIPYLSYIIQSIQFTGTRLNIDKIDMADRVDKIAHVKEWVDKNECEIVDQSYFNHTQEKNPNTVDFPPFNPSLINIVNAQAKIENQTLNIELAKDLRIEDSIVSIIDQNFNIDASQSKCSWSGKIAILAICNRETVLKTVCKVDVSHKCMSQVCSYEAGEMSPFFVEYILDVACKQIKKRVADKFHKYDFSRLADYLMESMGHIQHPKEDVEQSMMKHYSE